MTRTLTFVIPAHPPKELSPNAGKYIHPMKVHRIKGEWQGQVAWAIKVALHGAEWTPLEYASLTIERVIDNIHTRKMDSDDNLNAYFKSTRDVLKPMSKVNPYGMGIIREDNSKRLSSEYIQTVDPARAPMTLITVRMVTK